MTLKVDFGYLESCEATMEKYKGTLYWWVWQTVEGEGSCNDRHGEVKELVWELKKEVAGEPQILLSFEDLSSSEIKSTIQEKETIGGTIQTTVDGKDIDWNNYDAQASKVWKETSVIIGVDGQGIDLTMKLSGQVFLDQDSGKVNSGDSIMQGQEALNGVEVVLYEYDPVTKQSKVVEKTNKISTYHVHTASCYTNLVGNTLVRVHTHTGSWATTADKGNGIEPGGPNTCYNKPVTHVHDEKCYMKAIAHNHTDSCYGKDSHTHKRDGVITPGEKIVKDVLCYMFEAFNSTRFDEDIGNFVGQFYKGHTVLPGGGYDETVDKVGNADSESPRGGGYYYRVPWMNTHRHDKTIRLDRDGCYHVHNETCMVSHRHVHKNSEYNQYGNLEFCPYGIGEDWLQDIDDRNHWEIEYFCGYGQTDEELLVCDKTEETVPICGKQEGEIEYVESAQTTCGRDDKIILGYELSCTKPEFNTVTKNKQVLTCGQSGKLGNSNITTLLNPVITKTVNDKNGYYEFDGLDSMKQYFVKFVYNGVMYTNVLYNSINHPWVSKADETTKIPKNRENFNNKFSEIGSYPRNYQIVKKVFGEDLGSYNKVYLQEEIVDIFKLISEKMEGTNNDDYIIGCQRAYEDLKNNNKYKNNLTELKRKIQFAADCRISSYTVKQYPLTTKFVISDVSKTIGGITYPPIYSEMYNPYENGDNPDGREITGYGRYNQLHINLGIKARPTFDLALYKDVLKAEVTINGKTETYNYDTRKQSSTFKMGVKEEDYLNGLRAHYNNSETPYTNDKRTWNLETDINTLDMRTEEITNGEEANGIDEIYQTVTNTYENLRLNGKNKEERLKVYIYYKISITNQSSVIGAVTEIVDYFDPNYTFIDAYMIDNKGNKIENSVETRESQINYSKYGNITHYKSNTGAYKTIYLRPNEKRLNNGEKQDIYVKLELKTTQKDAGTILSEKLLKKEELETLNLAEINGYKTYERKTGDTTPGLIDIDSNPGNLNISNITALKQKELREYPNIKAMYEDDTSRAPALIYKLSESRTIEGVVFEDKTEKENDKIYTSETRQGDGILDKNDTTRIKGVKVELIEIKEGNMIVRAETTTNAGGWYGFTGFIPGDYTIRYTYGLDDKTAMTTTSKYQEHRGDNTKSYNGQDYQSTIFTNKQVDGKSKDIEKLTNITTDEVLKERYNINNTNKNTEESLVNVKEKTLIDKYENGFYWYTIADNLSDARDDANRTNEVIEYSRKEYGKAITNHKAEVFKAYEDEQANHINKDYNRELANELERRTYRYAYTPLMEIEVEYATKSVTGNQKPTDSNKKPYEYAIKGVDFGIVERPQSELVIDQDVEHIKVTLADGQTLIDTQRGINNTNEQHVQWIDDQTAWKYGLKGEALINAWKNLDINDKHQLVTIIMDDELLSGAQIEIRYRLTVTNNGEQDGNAKAQVKNIINYVANNLTFDAQDNNGYWKVVKKSDIQNGEKGTFINNNKEVVDLSTQSVILQATGNNPLISNKLKPGEQVNTYLVLKKVITAENATDDLRYTNLAEIVEIDSDVGRYDRGAIPGNQRLDKHPEEHDAAGASKEVPTNNLKLAYDGIITITPPTGSNYTIYIYCTIGIIVATILVGGIFIIKKYVLCKK